MGFLHWNGTKEMAFQLTKKMANNLRFHFFHYVEKYLNVCYITRCWIFFTTNHLISTNQSGLKPGDSCINQLLSTTHGMYKSFDEGYEVRGAFLVISKASDEVWHNGLIFKFEQDGISGILLRS